MLAGSRSDSTTALATAGTLENRADRRACISMPEASMSIAATKPMTALCQFENRRSEPHSPRYPGGGQWMKVTPAAAKPAATPAEIAARQVATTPAILLTRISPCDGLCRRCLWPLDAEVLGGLPLAVSPRRGVRSMGDRRASEDMLSG